METQSLDTSRGSFLSIFKKIPKAVLFSVVGLCVLSCTLYFCFIQKSEKMNFFGPIKEVDFDTAMGKGTTEYQFAFANQDDVTRYNTFKALWEKNLPSKVAMSDTAKIPKICHQIWLGPKLPPPYFLTFQEKWKALHPDWEFRLWTDSDLDKLDLELRDLIDLSPNWAEKSDILRAELLDKFGGMYIDVDMECNHSITELHHKYDFYIGLEYPHKIATTSNRIWGGISIMASCPGHPIMKKWKEYIRKRWEIVNETYTSPIEKVINHTYFPFTFSVMEKIHEGNYTNIAFPATYFYPLNAASAAKRRTSGLRAYREKIYEILEDLRLKRPRAFTRVYPETLAVHYWGNSWLSGGDDQVKELQRHVSFLKKEMYFLQQRLSRLEKLQTAVKAQEAGVHMKEMPIIVQPTQASTP